MLSRKIPNRDSRKTGGVGSAHGCSRRAVLIAGTSFAGGIAAGITTSGALHAAQDAAPAGNVWSGEYWAIKQRAGTEIKLALYRKRLGAPRPGEASRPVLFLVHGSSISARPSFDLSVPGREYSL